MELIPMMTIDITVEAPISAGSTPLGEVRVIPFTGGSFEGGADLRGTVLPGGTDWQTVRADGALEIRARYLLETDLGERIEVVSEGVRDAAPEVLGRLAAGEDVPSDQYYFRTSVRFATASDRLASLNSTLAVATGERRAGSVHLRVLRVP